MYSKYVKERENLDEIKTDKGFIHYRLDRDTCWINDYFVLREYRNEGHGYFLANQVFEICKELGVKNVFCQVDTRAAGQEFSTFTIENFGFDLIKEKGSLKFYKMGVREWEKR